jgi:hypothetical protein
LALATRARLWARRGAKKMTMLDEITPARISVPASAAQVPASGVVTVDDVLDEAERKRVFDFLRGAGWSFGWKSNGAHDQ